MSDSSLDLSGIWIALVTPFESGRHEPAVNHRALRHLVDQLRQAKVSGLVALGSTGEAASLSDAEQDAVVDTVLDAAADLPVIVGLSGAQTAWLHRRLDHLNRLPIHAVLSPAPCYVRPSQAGLIHHFRQMADLSRAPLMLYDIPYRTGVSMHLDTILTLAEHEHIVGIKDCGGSLDKTQAIIADGRLQVLAGEDAMIFHSLCLGAAGAISAAAQVKPHAFMDLYRAIEESRLDDARRLQHELAPWLRQLFSEPNPVRVKAALAAQGWMQATLRAPLAC